MSREPRLPWLARWLVRLSPVPRESRAEVQADLHELYVNRRRDRGPIHAWWRLGHDVASLWRQPRTIVDSRASPTKFAMLRDAGSDLRFAARLFARQPVVLALTVLGLSLGLGVATAAFGVINAATLRGEGLADPDRAPGVLRTTARSTSTTWTTDEFVQLRDGAARIALEAVLTENAATGQSPADAAAPSVGVAFVSGGFFAATGGRVMLGRPLVAADEQQTGTPAAVVSFVFWSARLHRDPAVIGRRIRIGRADATIVGVAERGFTLPHSRQIWMPLTAHGAVFGGASGRRAPAAGLQIFGRLLPDATLSDAQAQLTAVAAALPRSSGESALGVRLDSRAGLGRAPLSDTVAVTVFVFAVIVLVLVLACANVATALVSTAIAREREIGVRAALGASRARIVRQLVTESVALSTIAAAIGLLLAWWALPAIGAWIEAPAGSDLAPDGNVFLFLALVTTAAGVGAGLAPAWHGRGVDLATPLKGSDAHQDRVAPRRLRSALVMMQAAAAVMLIVTATLFVRASLRAAVIDVGFDADGLYAVSPGIGDPFDSTGDGADVLNFWARAVDELDTIPGIAATTLSQVTPFSGITMTSLTRDEPPRAIALHRTHANYFDAMGIRLLAGRTFTPDEVATGAPVALVSAALARAYWQDDSPLGKMLPPEIPLSTARPVVVGVVSDAITAALHERSPFALYEPLAPRDQRMSEMLIRVAPGSTGAIELAGERLRAIDPGADVAIASVASRLRGETGRPRTLALLTGGVGVIAIVLCVIGLYGLTASVVGQRTREMGVRIALGARPLDVLGLVVGRGARLALLGIAIGTVAGLALTRLLGGLVWGVDVSDIRTFVAAPLLVMAAALLASWVPARKAARVDPMVALRSE